MGKLYLDSYVESEGFGSTEEYILKRLSDPMSFLKFLDPETFLDLKQNGLIGKGAVVRTSTGQFDKIYDVNVDWYFVSRYVFTYPNVDRVVFSFDEVFAKENIDDGYTLEWSKFETCFGEWYKLNKK